MALHQGESTALLGETGCGKSVLAAGVFGLLPDNTRTDGRIQAFGHDNLLDLPEVGINRLRGRKMVLIPQNPHGSLNPVFSSGWQIAQSLALEPGRKRKQIRSMTLDLLNNVGFRNPEAVAAKFPHQLSGGMAQRVLIAGALAADPLLVIADEPTKGIDAADRNSLLRLMLDRFNGAAMLMITHDLEAASFCNHIAVMYAGELVETGSSHAILSRPRHPYTWGLVQADPVNGMIPMPGSPPRLDDLPDGCRFQDRCSRADSLCRQEHPAMTFSDSPSVRCHHADC